MAAARTPNAAHGAGVGIETGCPGFQPPDGEINVPDLIVLLGCWGSPITKPDCLCLDVDNSLDIRVPDLIELLGKWSIDQNGNGIPDACEP